MEGARSLALEIHLEGGLLLEPFEDVFRRVLPRALRVARRILGNDPRAEDAAAEALARSCFVEEGGIQALLRGLDSSRDREHRRRHRAP